jgi:hypothetical protein
LAFEPTSRGRLVSMNTPPIPKSRTRARSSRPSKVQNTQTRSGESIRDVSLREGEISF